MAPRKGSTARTPAGRLHSDSVAAKPPEPIQQLSQLVEREGGVVLATYREPLGAHWLLLAMLPLERVRATPYQRELSESHVKHLVEAMPKVERFLDPVIAVPGPEGGFWTPNGLHRLEAMKRLGARSITALVLPEQALATKILALNTERAHNVKDRSLEAVRMERALAEAGDERREDEFEEVFEEPAWLTLGLCYEARPRFAGTAYAPVVRRCEAFFAASLGQAIEARRERARLLLELDDAISVVVDALRQRGLQSPFLRGFLVARANPLRGSGRARTTAPVPFAPTVRKMIERVKAIDPARVRPQEIAALGGGGGLEPEP